MERLYRSLFCSCHYIKLSDAQEEGHGGVHLAALTAGQPDEAHSALLAGTRSLTFPRFFHFCVIRQRDFAAAVKPPINVHRRPGRTPERRTAPHRRFLRTTQLQKLSPPPVFMKSDDLSPGN